MAATIPTRRPPTRKVSRLPSASLKARIHQTLAEELGKAIVSGKYRPGESLPGEIESSQSLKISRNAYRESIRILAAKGLVESRQKAGTLVTPRARWNLLDPDVLHWLLSERGSNFLGALFELRLIVEPAAAALAAGRRTDEQLGQIEAALAEMRKHEPDSPASQKADEDFHAAILAAGENELLSRLASIIAAGVEAVAEIKRAQAGARDTWPDHKVLFDAIRDSDPAAASAAMAAIIENARRDLGMAARC